MVEVVESTVETVSVKVDKDLVGELVDIDIMNSFVVSLEGVARSVEDSAGCSDFIL